MSSTKRSEGWLWRAIRPLVIFAPLLIAAWSLVRFNSENSSSLLSFNQIHENVYIVSDVLLAFIVASYGIVFLGLCFYFLGAVNDLSKYKGDSNTVKFLNIVSLILLCAVLLTLILYLLTMAATCFDWLSQSLHEKLNIEIIVWLNKYLSFGIFLVFLIADLLAWKSQTLQEREYNNRIKVEPQNTHLKHLRDENASQIKLSRNATFLVNIPTVLLTGSMVILTSYLNQADRFRGAIDHHLHFIEIKHAVQPETFQLFLNGLEAGVIVCTIIYSQIVYVIIRTSWEPK